MLNEVALVGRLTKTPEIMENQDGSKFALINLAIPRSDKNTNGEYETDFIDCTISGNMANEICKYCEKGNIIGVRGKIQNVNYTSQLRIIAKKITFLADGQKD